MLVNGLSGDSLLFRRAIDRIQLTDKVVAPIANIQPRQLLNNTRALYEIIKHLSGEHGLQVLAEEAQADIFRTFWTSGVVSKGVWENSATPSEHNFGNDGTKPDILCFGPTSALVNGRLIQIPHMELYLPGPPGSGSRDDLLFLEAWLQRIDPVTGEGLWDRVLNVQDQVVFEHGNLDGELVRFQDAFPNITQHHLGGASEGDIIRIQYQWQIRSAEGVDFDAHPDGLDGPEVTSRKGGIFTPLGDGLYLDETHAIWAIPLAKVTRVFGENVVQKERVTSIRPPIKMIGMVDQNAVQKSGDHMSGELQMQGENGIVFGNRFRLVYNESEDSLDLELIDTAS